MRLEKLGQCSHNHRVGRAVGEECCELRGQGVETLVLQEHLGDKIACLLAVDDAGKQQLLLQAEMWDSFGREEGQELCHLLRWIGTLRGSAQATGRDQRVVVIMRKRDQCRVPFHSARAAAPTRNSTVSCAATTGMPAEIT